MVMDRTEDGRQLDQLAHGRDLPDFTEILMADDRLRHTLRLLPRSDGSCGSRILQDVQGEKASIELEAQTSQALILFRRADIMQDARQEVGLIRKGPVREAVLLDRLSIVVYPKRMVVGRFGQVRLRIELYPLSERRRRDGSLRDGD